MMWLKATDKETLASIEMGIPPDTNLDKVREGIKELVSMFVCSTNGSVIELKPEQFLFEIVEDET